MSSYYLYVNLDDKTNRTSCIVWCIGKFLFFIFPIFLLFCLGLLNGFPLIPWGYGFVYHIPEFLNIVLFITAFSYYLPAIIISLILSALLLIVDGFAFGISIYTVVICYIESIPTNCTSMQFTYILVSIFSGILFVISIIIFYKFIPITKRMIKAQIRKRKQKKS
jgi:hypothetical protein